MLVSFSSHPSYTAFNSDSAKSSKAIEADNNTDNQKQTPDKTTNGQPAIATEQHVTVNAPSELSHERPLSAESHSINAEQQNKKQEQSDTEISEKDHSKNSNQHATYTEQELKLISQLKTREAEVHAHEQAHAAVGGQYTGSPSYDYQTGPDGVKYAVSGEVSIDTSEIPGDPQATLRKAKQIKAAALAPADPSSQDLKVAAKADRMATEARSDILAENTDTEVENKKNLQNTGRDYFGNFIDRMESESVTNESAQLMNDRNSHINDYYKKSSINKALASFELIV